MAAGEKRSLRNSFARREKMPSCSGQTARQVRAAMREWGMDTTGLQSDSQHPTGSVRIAMQGTQHSFEILPQQDGRDEAKFRMVPEGV